MFIVDLRHQFQDERCNDNTNICTRFDIMCTMCEDLAVLGDDFSDEDFSVLLGHFPVIQLLPFSSYCHSECPGYKN